MVVTCVSWPSIPPLACPNTKDINTLQNITKSALRLCHNLKRRRAGGYKFGLSRKLRDSPSLRLLLQGDVINRLIAEVLANKSNIQVAEKRRQLRESDL